MKSIFFSSPLNLVASGGRRRFKINAYSGGVLRVDGFRDGVIVDLQGIDTSTSIPILIDHQATTENTLGLTDSISNDGRSLTLSGKITGTSRTAQSVLAQSAAGHTWQASIGAMVIESEDIAAGQTVAVNGLRFSGPVTVARRSVLRETSVLPMGADATTSVNLAARAAVLGKPVMTFEEYVKSLGLDVATLTPEATAVLQTAFESQKPTADGETPGPTAAAAAHLNLRASASAELRRHGEINAVCAGFPMIAATAIQAGWSPLEAENHVLRAKATRMAPSNFVSASGHSRYAGGGHTRESLGAGLMIRAGLESVAVKSYGAEVCEAARGARLTNLVDVAAACLTMAGRDRAEFKTDSEMVRAAFSTTSLPTVLADTVGRSMESAYEEQTSEFKKFCHIANAADFRTQTGIRPQAISNLEELGAGGRIKHGKLAEEDTYTWAVDTYAKMLSITRKDITNDDLGFIEQLSPMMGTAAGRALNDLLWSTILGAQTANWFATANLNLATTGSALAVATLAAGVAAMRSQRDSQGIDVGQSPVALVVPPALELTARALLNSNDLLGTDGPSGNPVRGIVQHLIVEPRIANSTRFSNTSATQWYLFGAPQARAVTVGFLNGAKSPTVETQDADFNTLGISLRAYHDFGVALADPRAAYKASGAA